MPNSDPGPGNTTNPYLSHSIPYTYETMPDGTLEQLEEGIKDTLNTVTWDRSGGHLTIIPEGTDDTDLMM